ncbi:phage gp6-like head-tail connector protein [Lactobacillus sp. PV037]|uniref:head-tail connector protein n=1 Tax=Lactobacillus sp. PV037 TaxID=2594496 RepID=UPI00223EC746|nr:head-tail connector protein [Lactobacillus sp. PV037]QNQ83760.1 phage gp6-like head-tail connector protein [Lactobacillus sp. PV037]
MSISKLMSEVDDEMLKQFKIYAKVDSEIEDDLLKMWLLSAQRKVIGEVGKKIDDFFDDNPAFMAAVLIDAYTHYNNRDADSNAMIFEKPEYRNDVNQLKDDYRDLTVSLDDDYYRVYGDDLNG